MVLVLFKILVGLHIVSGTIGLLAMWGPIFTRNGSRLHKSWGKVFIVSMIVTGAVAVGISICSLIEPLQTHPFSDDPVLIRGLFGWMMMYLGILTVALAWHGYRALKTKRDPAARRSDHLTLGLQVLMGASALLCAGYGFAIDQAIMVGVAVPGLAAAILNAASIVERNPPHNEWLVQHFRASIGAGISVYTAFFAFGAVNWFPALAFNPILWAIPTVLGVAYMLFHQVAVFQQRVRMGLARQMRVGRHFAFAVTVPAREA
ncbi:MAG: hypothetical protein ACFCUN_06095 [Hyphomicrobiaceae bacterium]